MAAQSSYPSFSPNDHEAFMSYALEQAQKSPPAPNKFCVGAALVDGDSGEVLSTRYSHEFPRDHQGDPGTTHAEQCCFIKIAAKRNIPEERIGEVLPPNTVLILRLNGAIKTGYVGLKEPGNFIARNDGQERLEANGVKVVYPVEHMRERITEVSLAGHDV